MLPARLMVSSLKIEVTLVPFLADDILNLIPYFLANYSARVLISCKYEDVSGGTSMRSSLLPIK